MPLSYLLTRSWLRSTTLSTAGGKEGKKIFRIPAPSLWLAIERVDDRSDVGVSQLSAMQITL